MKRHSESCSCTNCAYKIRSKRPSVQQVLADGTRIDKLFYGKYLPLRERKLLEKLVRTRAVYDNVKDRLLSASGSSDLTKSDYTGKSQGYYSNRKKKIIEVSDRGEIRSSNTSKLSSCCNCCSCSSLKKIKKSIEKHPHVHKHYVPYENIAKYNTNAEIRAKARRRRLGSKISEKMRDFRYKSKNVRSDPCFCTLSLMKFSSKRSIKRLGLKKDAKRGIGPSISLAESELEHRSKAGQKLRSIRQSIVNSIESRFKIKKDSLSLFRAKLRKRGMRRRRHDLETYAPEFRPRRRRRGKESHHRLSTIYVKSVTSSTSKPKLKTSAVKMKSKRKIRKRHKKNKEMKTLNQESQVSVPGKMTSKPSQYQKRKPGTSSSIATTPLKTSSKSEVQTQIKPRKKSTTKHTSAAQSSTSVSLKKNQTEFSLRRCFCTLRLQKKKRKLRSTKSKKTTSFSTQHSDNVPKENLLSPTDCECDTEMKTRFHKEMKGSRKLTNTEKSPQKSTSSLIFEHRSPHTRHEKTQSKKKKIKNAYAKGVEVHRPSVNAMTSLLVKSNKSKPTNTEAFWHKCFCTLKLFNKDGSKKHSGAIIQPRKKKDVIVKVHSKMTTKHSENIKYFHEPSRLSSFQCEPGICSPDQCNPQECKKIMTARPIQSKNKYSDTSSKNIVLIHENPKLLPYECKPGVCIPDQCNPSECEKLIKQRSKQHKSKYQETNFNTRSTYIEIPKQMISSKTQQSPSQTRGKKINKINHYSREPVGNIGSGHSNRETVRIGSNFSFNIEFYKERSLGDGIKESDNTTKIVKKQVREKTLKKSEYTRPRSVNVKTKGFQSTTDTKHIASSVEPKTKKRHVYVGSPKKTKCFCTLKLHKKGRNAINKENTFLTSRSTKTTLELFEPELNTSVIKSTNTSKILRHELKSYECTPGFCVPNMCDPYKCYDNIKKRDIRRYRSRHIATGRELRSVLSNTSSSSNKSRNTQSSYVVEPLQEHRVKNRPDNNDSNYSPSRQAVRIGSNFSFNIDFYKDQYNMNTRGKTIPTMFNTVGNLTYISDIKPKSMDYSQFISKHILLRASDIIKTNDKVPNVGNILKRCFCSLLLQSKDCGRNDNNPCNFNPGITQLTEVIPGRQQEKSVCKLKSINPLCITRRKFSEKYISRHDMHMNNLMPFICHPKSKLNQNGAICNVKRQNGCRRNKSSRNSHSSYNDFGKYDVNTNNSIPKLQQYSQYQVKKVLNDSAQRNDNPFYNSFYALNLKVSRVRKISKDLEDDECEPDFCVPYQCDTAECLRRIKSRLKSWKETGTNSTDTQQAASMTDRMRSSHNYVQADKRRTLKDFHPTKKKTRYGSNVKLNMSLYTHLDDTNKQPGQRTPIPQFYDAQRNKTEDEKKRDYNRPAPTRSQQKSYHSQNNSLQREDLISSKQKARKMSSLKKYASAKLKSQDNQRENILEADGDGSALVPKPSRKQRKTSNMQTEATVTKTAHIGKEHKSMNIATDRELIDLSKPRKLKKNDEALDSAAITKLIHLSKFRKAKSIKLEPDVAESQKIQEGKSRKSVHIVEPKVIYSGKYKKTVHVPTDPNEIPKSIYRGKYREKISAPTEPEASKSSFSSKYRKLMKIRTDRASRLSRLKRTKMPEELEKFLMKPPRRKVYTIGSNINFSMQFYKEDDSLAVNEEQEAEQTDAASGMLEKIRCFCTSKKRDSQNIKSKQESQGSDTESMEEESVNKSTNEKVSVKTCEIKSKKSSMEKSRGKGSQKTKKSDLIDSYQRELDEICKFEPEFTEKKDDKALSKERRVSKGSKDIKSKKEGQDGDKELLKEERVSKGSKDIKSKKEKEDGDKASRKDESVNKSTKEQGAKKPDETELKVSGMEKSRGEGSQKIKKSEPEATEKKEEKEHGASDKMDKIKCEIAKSILGIKSICKCKMPVCTCKMPVCKCKMPVCKCEMPVCKCKMPECKCKMPECKCKMPECKCKMPECKCKVKGHKNENALYDGELKSRRLRSKSTKVLRKALSVKSDVLNYDKSTLTDGKRVAKSLYECEPHVCIPGICDPNVCLKIFKSQRCVKNIGVSTIQDVKSKLINTPITLTSTHFAASAVKRCFCIFQLKNKQAENMIDKSMPRIKQEKDVEQFTAQNFLRKSFGKINSLLKKSKSPNQKELVSENGQLLKQNMDMKPGVPEYTPQDSKLPELSSKKRKRHLCKCHKNIKQKKICECVQENLDKSKYPQPALPDSYQYEEIETFPPKVALRPQDKRKLNKMDQNLKSKNLKGDGSKTIVPQIEEKVGRQPICQECRKYTICKCKKRISRKTVCKCQLQAMDYSTALELETPLTDTDKSDENKLLFKRIKCIPPRLSQSLKSKLGNIKKKTKPVKKIKNKQEVPKKSKRPQRKLQINIKNEAVAKPDKIKQKIAMDIGDDYEVDKTIPKISKSKKSKSKFKGICECPLVKDLEGETTDTGKVRRKQSIIEAAKRISRSLKSKAPLLGLSLKKQPKKPKNQKKQELPASSESDKEGQVSYPPRKIKPHFICECYPKKSRKPLSPLLALGNLAAGDTKTKKQAVGGQIGQGQEQATKAAGDQELKETKKKPGYLKIEQGSAGLAVCPCCGKSDYIQSLNPTLKSQLKTETGFPFLKNKPPRGPMIPGLENACALCLKQNLTDVCTCSSKKGRGVYLPASSFQNVCPECSKKMVIGAKTPQAVTEAKPLQASSRKNYSFEPSIPAILECLKQRCKKDKPPPSPPIFNMYVDATNMKLKNKEEIYRNLGIGCKDKLQGSHLPPVEKGQKVKPSIDLVIDRDNASILRPGNMMQTFGVDKGRKYNTPKQGSKAGTRHSVACPICNPLQVGTDASKRSQGGEQNKEHDEHCTCCICTDKDGKRKKGHPKNCTCCICRYGCRFGTPRQPAEPAGTGSSKFPNKSQLLKKGEIESKKETTSIKKPEEKKNLPVALKAQNKFRNLTKVLQAPKSCYCGLKICDKELKHQEADASSVLEGDIPPPCICGSYICKKKYLQKNKYYRLLEQKRLTERKQKKERFKRWKREATARIKEQDAEDADFRKRVLRQDKKSMAALEKYIDDTSSWVLLAENASEIGRFGINTVRRMITNVKRCARHPLDVCYKAQIARENPQRAAAKALEEFQGSGYSGMTERVRQRCAAMQTSRYLISALEKHPVTNYLYHFRDRDPRKRLFKRRPEKELTQEQCSPFLTSLRQKPCLWLYHLCPWFYPHCLGFLALWRQFTDVILFLLAVAVWSPCILLTEFCRSVMCCVMCAGGG